MDPVIRRALAPTDAELSAVGINTNVKVVTGLLGTGRGRALDIGCGAGKFTRALTALFREVCGVDVKERAIDAARKTAAEEGVSVDFRVASAEALPWSDGHFEFVVFSNSLHHMPDPAKALAEASRVLAQGGLLYVMEPVPSGSYHRATYLINDETVVRTKAYEAMLERVRLGFSRHAEVVYRNRRTFGSYDEWKSDQMDRDEKRRAKFEADGDAVRAAFEGAACHEDGALAFTQAFRVDSWRKD